MIVADDGGGHLGGHAQRHGHRACRRRSALRTYWEGLTTIPNNPTEYGPLAGTIMVADENQHHLHHQHRRGT